MPLDKSNLPISFNQGIDTKTDPKQVMPGKLLTLQNAVMQTPKELRKRNGYQALPNATYLPNYSKSTISQGVGVGIFQEELVMLDGNNLFSFAEATQIWSLKGNLTTSSLITKPVVRNSYSQTQSDSAMAANGFQCFVWTSTQPNATIQASIVDHSTGMTVFEFTVSPVNGIHPRVEYLNGFFYIFFSDQGFNNIYYVKINTVDPSLSLPASPVALTTDQSLTLTNFDTSVISDGINPRIYILYNDNAAGIAAWYITAAGSAVGAFPLATKPGTVVGLWGDTAGNIWIGYFSLAFTTIYYQVWNAGFIANLVPESVVAPAITGCSNITGIFLTGQTSFFYETFGGPGDRAAIGIHITIGGGVLDEFYHGYQVGLASKPYIANSQIFIGITYQNSNGSAVSIQATYFITTFVSGATQTSTAIDHFLVAKIAPSLGGGYTAVNSLPSARVINSTTMQFTFSQKDLLVSNDGAVFAQLGVMSAEVTMFTTPQMAQLGRNLHISGGIVWAYDGLNVVEDGFHIFPEQITVSTTSPGGSIDGGTYQYVVMYEWFDNQGQPHRSAPSIPVQIVMPAGPSNVGHVTFRQLSLTQKVNGPVSIVVYRTTNLAAGGGIFYRVTSVTSPILNNTQTSTQLTFNDTFNDSSIIGNEQLYTTGGVIENIGPPATKALTTYNNRLILIPSESDLQWWYSQEVVPGQPVEFSDLLVQNVDQRGGGITATIQMDDKLVLFKSKNIFVVTGQGPSPSGAANDYTSGQLVASDSGCTIRDSVVLTDMGIFYQAPKGMSLLDRSLAASFIGADVNSFTDTQSCTSAILVSGVNQARFTLSGGIAIVFDYFMKQWYTFANHLAVGAVIFQNQYSFLNPTGPTVFQETPGSFTDNGNFVGISLTTGWLSFAALQGFQRVYKLEILGEFKSAHQLKVEVAYDFDPAVMQTDIINAINMPLYQYRVFLARQKCEAIRFTITELQVPTFGEGLSLSSMAFEIGVKRGLNKLPPTQSYG